MRREQFRLGLLAMLVGAAFAYWQTNQRRAPERVRAPIVAEQTRQSSSAEESGARGASKAFVPYSEREYEAASSDPKAELVAPIHAPEVLPTSPVSGGRTELFRSRPTEERPMRIRMPLKDDERLWNACIEPGLAKVEDSAGILDFIKASEKKETGLQAMSFNAGNIGPACQLMKSDDTNVIGRVAGGFSNGYDGVKDGRQIPEMVFGLQFEHEIDKRNKIVGAFEFARDITEVGRRRAKTDAAWETLLDPEKNISLRTGISKSSNTAPNGDETKNLDYSLDVIWKF